MADVAHSTTNIVGGHTSATSSVAGFQSAADKAKQDAAANQIDVRMAAVSAIPAYTYNNGAAGIGATLTGNANGAAAAIDGLTPALNDLMHFPFGVNAFECGVYKLTQVGDGSNPFIWTRSTLADTSAKILGSRINVTDGVQGRGIYQFATTAAVTIGTDPLFWLRTSVDANPTEMIQMGGDLTSPLCPNAAATTQAEGMICLAVGTGSAISVVTNANTAARIGQWRLATGTTTTGQCSLITFNTSNDGFTCLLATNTAFFVMWKGSVSSALSDGTNSYTVWIGFADSVTTTFTTPANGVGVQYDLQTGGEVHWRFVTVNASTATKTASGTTVTLGVDDVVVLKKDAGTNLCQCWINGTQVGTGQSTNVPTANPVSPRVGIFKQASTTSRTLDTDVLVARFWQPARRAA